MDVHLHDRLVANKKDADKHTVSIADAKAFRRQWRMEVYHGCRTLVLTCDRHVSKLPPKIILPLN